MTEAAERVPHPYLDALRGRPTPDLVDVGEALLLECRARKSVLKSRMDRLDAMPIVHEVVTTASAWLRDRKYHVFLDDDELAELLGRVDADLAARPGEAALVLRAWAEALDGACGHQFYGGFQARTEGTEGSY